MPIRAKIQTALETFSKIVRRNRRLSLNLLAVLMVFGDMLADASGALIFAAVALFVLVRIVFRPMRKLSLPLSKPVEVHDPLIVALDALDALPVPVIMLDRQEIVRHANELARQLFPGLRDGVPISFAVRFPELLEAIDQVRDGAQHVEIDLVERVPVERSFEAHIRSLAHQGINPSDPSLMITLLDTTKARQVEAMRVDFVANASHELRTPLASIVGFVETLQGPARNDEAMREKFLGIMAQQGRRMARLIDDLLSLSRIELSAHLAPKGQVNLEIEIGHIIETLAGLAREQKVELVILPQEKGETIVAGDRDEILRVFENLIENAIKYGASGGRVEIAIRKNEQAGEALISIRDFGPGIAAVHIPRLTERFYRADVEASRALGGTGLGLAIVKHILNRHRGRLHVETRLGEGATFTVLLPTLKKSQ